MSPEQAQGADAVDARTDVWALGVLAYQCLAGRPPFVANNYNALMLAIMTTPHRPIDDRVAGLPRELSEVIEGCLTKDREARIATAREVAERLEAVARRLSRGGERGRRATDRLPPAPLPAPRVPAGARMPDQAFPVGVRAWRSLMQRAPRRAIAAGGVLGGTLLGIGIGMMLVGSAPAEPVVVQAAPLVAAPALARAAVREVATPERPGVVPPPKSAGDESLARAAARGLGVQRKSPRRAAKPAPKVALTP
jgi:hypothetical protein